MKPNLPVSPVPTGEPLTIFISHTSADDTTVARLRRVLRAEGYVVREDGTSFDVTQTLPTQIQELLDHCHRVIVLVSEAAAESSWVAREIRYAVRDRKLGIKNVIPILLPEATTDHLQKVFSLEEKEGEEDLLEYYPEEPIAIVTDGTPQNPNLSAILPTLSERLRGRSFYGEDTGGEQQVGEAFAELTFEIIEPFIDEEDQSSARCLLHFTPPGDSAPSLSSEPFWFTPPIGVIEAGEISFYLERYHITPFGQFTERKEKIEAALAQWGEQLYQALAPSVHDALFGLWEEHASAPRRFTILTQKVPRDPDIPNPQKHPVVAEILSLPWELLHDGDAYFFKDGRGARVRRCLPTAKRLAAPQTSHVEPPLRVLIVCSRPESDAAGYIDHRVSARPLVEALESLGDLATWDILAPATLANLRATVDAAYAEHRPYHIVHFDGHGIYDRHLGLGQLVFEAADDDSLQDRKDELVDAETLGGEISRKGVRLFFLEACQSAQSGDETDSSVAGKLIGAGIPSVAAMSHSVLVETARQFTSVFYPALLRGRRVGSAMLEGQRALAADRMRDPRVPLELDDWFVPILFQHSSDEPVLEVSPPSERIQHELAKHRALYFGAVPPPPQHSFIGRSRQLLMAERLLIERDLPWVLFRGEGGEGKTTTAAELARWLVQSRPRQLPRAAFASVELISDLRAILCEWGEQLLPNDFVSRAETEEAAIELLIAVLDDTPAVLILDNLESILPDPSAEGDSSDIAEEQSRLLPAIHQILARSPRTKLILTSRELPPESSRYRSADQTIGLGRLAPSEAKELVANVLAAEAKKRGQQVKAHQLEIEKEEEISHLVELVHGHARAICLLTPELFDRGLRATATDLAEIMVEMQTREGAGRETSLMASMELSLRRLPAEVRAGLLPLGVFQGGASLIAFAECIGVDVFKDEAVPYVRGLLQTGLAEYIPLKLPYLRFDPALAPALLHELRQSSPAAEIDARRSWIDAYRQLAGFLAQQQGSDIHLAYQLTRMELPNLLAALDAFASDQDAEAVVAFATDLESLLASLHIPTAMARVIRIREAAARALAGAPWSEAAFLAQRQKIERCWANSQIREALALAENLVEKTTTAGPAAYSGADYDIAVAFLTLGRAQRLAGRASLALAALEKAQAEFGRIAEERDNQNAARMASVCLTERADCLCDERQLDKAAELYQEAIERARTLEDHHAVGAGTHQLATCRLLQQQYGEAIALYEKAKDLFESLNEPKEVAISWHQVGIVFERTRQWEQAENAYQQSLRIKVQIADQAGEASSRAQLGSLYMRMGRLEDSVVFLRRAAEIDVELGDTQNEGLTLSNLAQSLILLNRHDEARTALNRATACNSQFGISTEPWKTWNILADLEQATGNPSAATQAKQKAIHAYAEARRRGWQETNGAGAELCATTHAVITQQPEGIPETKAQLQQLASQSDAPDYFKALIQQLLLLLDGSRDPSLWQHPDLDYDDATEILLLLEKLAAPATPSLDAGQIRQIAEENDIDLAALSSEEKSV